MPPSQTNRSGRRGTSPRRAPSEIERLLSLDSAAIVDAEGLKYEVALLRAAIRRIATNGNLADSVKVLAELRHQVETLCTALKTQHALDRRTADAVSAALARILEEIGDEIGVPK
ncbi:MAG TPA: hypothetical protein VEQ11_02030 [Chloroflexota bacterium]|nr:hypothetical protein [Chloroflexota bacterium]